MTPARQIRIASREGIVRPVMAWNARAQAPIPYWAACAFLMQESSGGHNVFGHDPTIFVGHGEVTRCNYEAYKKERLRTGQVQGVGPMQLTWGPFQDRADELGGCWKPSVNMFVAFTILRQHRDASVDWREAARRYNGSGPAAERYADQMEERFEYWKGLFSG